MWTRLLGSWPMTWASLLISLGHFPFFRQFSSVHSMTIIAFVHIVLFSLVCHLITLRFPLICMFLFCRCLLAAVNYGLVSFSHRWQPFKSRCRVSPSGHEYPWVDCSFTVSPFILTHKVNVCFYVLQFDLPTRSQFA